ncbi:MAG: SsrA-binding protein SmpB [Candidatus Pacebacteria bacterium]|nr:SsrA-binding protein SmpB [Candidatus Paceibacterota bacterium]PIR59968.1 MAG: SsrA-binding protein [Candidatus Pacebacteria bacterium CG10_big_fil_rev_8_21_14_0_10_44_54]
MQLVGNRKARFEYEISEKFVAGIVLSGHEVKSVRLGQARLVGSFVQILDGEAFLLNALISPYKFATVPDYEPQQTRKLLLKKSELLALQSFNKDKNRALVPLAFELERNRIKVVIGIGKPRKKVDKRAYLKKRAEVRDQRALL